jgi:hypothetical protein
MKKHEQVDTPDQTHALDGMAPDTESDDETQELRTLSAEEVERKLAERKPPER